MSLSATMTIPNCRLSSLRRFQPNCPRSATMSSPSINKSPHQVNRSNSSQILTRRDVLKDTLSIFLLAQLTRLALPRTSKASLVIMPTAQLKNTYYLIRAGESENESEDYIDTNPVNKTSMSNGLSEAGKQQVLKETIPKLLDLGACAGSCWLWPSITQNSYQTAELIAYEFDIGRDRIVPEFSFLDMRGLGAFDRLTPAESYSKIHAVDEEGAFLRPPPTTTGTPNESARDVLVRMRQLMSVLETQYLGADVLVISPDSENLSVLQTAVLGEAESKHYDYAFRPGECRRLELAKEVPERKSYSLDCAKPPNCL